MKRALAFASIVAAVGTLSASALTINVGDYQVGGGGEFNAANTPYGAGYVAGVTIFGGANPGFATFCLESDENIRDGGIYDYVQSQAADAGGSGGPSPDPISAATAWLYCQFATGNLAGYDYADAVSRDASADALQKAIWWLEDEVGGVNNAFVAAALAAVALDGFAAGDDNNGYYPTYVLNLTSNNGRVMNQDVLVYVPPSVPDGGMTLVMLGAGLTGLALARRRLA